MACQSMIDKSNTIFKLITLPATWPLINFWWTLKLHSDRDVRSCCCLLLFSSYSSSLIGIIIVALLLSLSFPSFLASFSFSSAFLLLCLSLSLLWLLPPSLSPFYGRVSLIGLTRMSEGSLVYLKILFLICIISPPHSRYSLFITDCITDCLQ